MTLEELKELIEQLPESAKTARVELEGGWGTPDRVEYQLGTVFIITQGDGPGSEG